MSEKNTESWTFEQVLDTALWYLQGAALKSTDYVEFHEMKKIMETKMHLPDIEVIVNKLSIDGHVLTSASRVKISGSGKDFIEKVGYVKQKEVKDKLDALTDKKLRLDVANAERVYRTYQSTRFIAWAGFILTILAIVLKILESNHLWPFHK